MKILLFQSCFALGLTLQAHVPPSSGEASISSGVLSLCSSHGVFPPTKCFPMHFATHSYPSGVAHKPVSGSRVAISAAQKWVVTLQGQTLVTSTLAAAGSPSPPWLWVPSQW